MTTAITICTSALIQLGKAPIASFRDPGDLARICANVYPAERDSLLREHPWNCVTKRVILAPSADAPAYGYSAQFVLPSDFLRLVSVGDTRYSRYTADCFKLEGGRILASGTSLHLEYVFRNEVEATWDPKLVELMQARMLWKLAYPLTQSTSLREELRNEYGALAKVARSIDSQENPSDTFGDEFPLLAGRY